MRRAAPSLPGRPRKKDRSRRRSWSVSRRVKPRVKVPFRRRGAPGVTGHHLAGAVLGLPERIFHSKRWEPPLRYTPTLSGSEKALAC